MNNKKRSSAEPQTAIVKSKDSDYYLDNPIRLEILHLFLSGGKYSVADLSQLLNIPDPCSHIRYIRMAGYPVSDYWVYTKFSKYKVYFIHTGKRR